MNPFCPDRLHVSSPIYHQEIRHSQYMHKFVPCISTPNFSCPIGSFQLKVMGYSKSQCLVTLFNRGNQLASCYRFIITLHLDYFTDRGWVRNGLLTGEISFSPKDLVKHQLLDYPGILVNESKTDLKLILINAVNHPIPDTVPFLENSTTLSMLNIPEYSDTLLQVNPVTLVHVSKLLLSQKSPFFYNLFKGQWKESTQPNYVIQPLFTSSAIFLFLLHIYGDWCPGDPLPAPGNYLNIQVLMDAIDFQDNDVRQYDLMHELACLANMYGLASLEKRAHLERISLIQDQLNGLK